MKKTTVSLGHIVADSVTAMLAYWDNDLICRYANVAYLDWFGKTSDEMLGVMSLRELLSVAAEPFEHYLKGALAGEVQEFILTIPLEGYDLKRYLQISFFPDTDKSDPKGFVMYAADITTIKDLEQQIEQSNEIIKSKNKSLLNFANIVSHDLRAYSANLEGMLELYESEQNEKERTEIFEKLKELSARFGSSVKNLSEIVEVKNLGDVPIQEVNLFESVTKATEVLDTQIKGAKAVVKVNVSPFIYIDANPAYVDSIVYNFLSNAIKYKHPKRDPVVELSTMIVGNETVLSIKDNGMGIDLDKHSHNLYGMYKTFHDNEDSNGIGLFISKYQVDSMGGHIGVESHVDKGTWFRIYFRTKSVAV